jgi:hypothetical protein
MSTNETRKIVVSARMVGAYEYLCTPQCELSYLACQLVRQDYLDSAQIKILELMGFQVQVVNKDENNFYGD